MAVTPLVETSRIKLLNHFIGDVRAWKADDAAETVILGAKDPARDPNNTSFYAMSRAGVLSYLGTTQFGKDGGVQPLVYNDGTVAVLITEAPAPGDSGNLADLYLVTLQYRLTGEPAASAGVLVDAYARQQVALHEARLDKIAVAAAG